KAIPCEVFGLREGFKTLVRQLNTRFAFAFAEEFPRDKGVSFVALIPPTVYQLLLRNHFQHFTQVNVLLPSFLAADKAELKSHLRLEFGNVEIPMLHVFLRRYRLPHFRDGRIVGTLENNGLRYY